MVCNEQLWVKNLSDFATLKVDTYKDLSNVGFFCASFSIGTGTVNVFGTDKNLYFLKIRLLGLEISIYFIFNNSVPNFNKKCFSITLFL